MPSSTRFSATNNSDASENPKQGLLDDSDFEDLSDNHNHRHISTNHYWLGKKIFSQMLAEKLFRDTTEFRGSDDLDADLVQAVAQYPYHDQTRRIRSVSSFQTFLMEPDQDAGNFKVFVAGLAAAYLPSNIDDRLRLTTIVQNGIENVSRSMAPRLVSQPYSTSAATAEQSTSSTLADSCDCSVERARYTIALKEYGDQNRIDVRWEDRQMSFIPLSWQVSAMTNNEVFQATAGNKRDARHRASQLACEALEIPL